MSHESTVTPTDVLLRPDGGVESETLPAAQGLPAPSVELPGVCGTEGGMFRLEDFLTKGTVVLAFSTFDSLAQLDFLNWFHLTDGVVGVAIADASQRECRRFARSSRAVFPVLSDADESVANAFGLDYDASVPETDGGIFVVDRSGRIRTGWSLGAEYDPVEVHETARVVEFGPAASRRGE